MLFKGLEINCSCLSMCFPIIRCVSCYLVTFYYQLSASICYALPLPCNNISVSDHNWPWIYIIMYIPNLALTSIRTSITLVNVQSSDHLITGAIQSHSLYNCPSHMDARYRISQDLAFWLHNGCFRSCEFHTNTF